MNTFFMLVWDYLQENPIEAIGMFFGLTSVYLMTRENPWGWPVGLVSVVAYIFVFWKAFLFGDFLLHIYYLGIGFYGWYHWLRGGRQHQPLPISIGSPKEYGWLAGLGTAGTVVMGLIFSSYPQASVPYWDAATTSFSLVGQWQQAQKRVENWLTWIVVDLVASGIYFYKELYLTAILYLLYTFLATKGYLEWRGKYRANG
jgi:nicotinamide mononucleotide transporter